MHSYTNNHRQGAKMKRDYLLKHVENFEELVLALDEIQNDERNATETKDYLQMITKLRILKDLHFLWRNEDNRINNPKKEDKKLTVLYHYIDTWIENLVDFVEYNKSYKVQR